MLHVAASARYPGGLRVREEDECDWCMPARLDELRAICEAFRVGREHVSIWTADIDALFVRWYVRDGELHDPDHGTPNQLDAVFGSQGLQMFRVSSWIWVRSTQGWVDATPDELASELAPEIGPEKAPGERETVAVWRFVDQLRSRLGDALDVELKATAASASAELYRDLDIHEDGGLSSWCPDVARADFLWRNVYYAGRTQAFGRGLIHRAGHQPGAEWTRRDWQITSLDGKQRLYHVDIRSAYPAIMREQLADVWQAPVQLADAPGSSDWPDRVFGGWAEVDVRIVSPEASILPVRRQVDGERRMTWPKSGRWRGIWPVTLLQAGERMGLLHVERTHRGEAWTCGYRPLELHSRTIEAAGAGSTGYVRQAIKRAGRAMSGKLAQGRTMNVLVTLDQLDAAERDEHGRPRVGNGVVTRNSPAWGCYTLARVEQDAFPESSNPVWGAEITARGIVRLAEAELTVVRAGGVPIYCDTDCWIFAADGRYMAPDVPLDIGTKTGQWRVESCPDWLIVLGPKQYFEGGHPCRTSVWAGVPRHAQLDGWYRGDTVYERDATVAEQFGSRPEGSPGAMRVCYRELEGAPRDYLDDAYIWPSASNEVDDEEERDPFDGDEQERAERRERAERFWFGTAGRARRYAD